ncbi:MAG: hypothetical protein CMJ18_21825 [Phycisphaeraceae bacterium]|nr:hypothetical protein [Phycisphaeraceae bacterium]
MPIISHIGRRSWKVRVLFAAMYLALALGAATMIYPFLLMISGSFKSEVDTDAFTIVPAYWFDDDVLYRKYLESRYVYVDRTEAVHQQVYQSWDRIEPVDRIDPAWVEAYRAYRAQADWPVSWFMVAEAGGTGHRRYFRRHARGFRKVMRRRFDDDLKAMNDHFRSGFESWEEVALFTHGLHSRRYRSIADPPDDDIQSAFNVYKRSVPPRDRVPVNLDGFFWHMYLRPVYGSLEGYNREHGTEWGDPRRIRLSRRAPRAPKAREDWQVYVREELNLAFLRLDDRLADRFGDFVARLDRYPDIDAYNVAHGTAWTGFDAIPFPTSVPPTLLAQDDWSAFIRDRDVCPVEAIEVYGPTHAFIDHAAQAGVTPADEMLALPLAEADHADFVERKGAIRWEEVRRNYIHVADYILLHGKAVRNTAIYCFLSVLTTLLVNPMAAYGLSRYRLPSQYKVLLICMATMAFPAEVTMIPAFVLLKHFPLWSLVVGVAVAAAVLVFGLRRFPRAPEAIVASIATGAGVVAGWWVVPWIAGAIGIDVGPVSTLNTFWALILPSMANGYGIFLLKGFFDSLPREMYEMADIDGAGPWTQFWSMTMALSKPILAVLALSAFTAAYSEFMMALIIIPDRDMWTLMVWIFQLQISAPRPVIQTSVLLAGIPTLLVFIFCQRLIIRGIVVPVEK